MTACSRRNFVSGMGALILMTGTSVTSLAKEEKADKPKRYAMVHDETACIGCTACMDACRETNHVPEGVSRLEILRSEPYGCLLYTSPSPRDKRQSRMPSSA